MIAFLFIGQGYYVGRFKTGQAFSPYNIYNLIIDEGLSNRSLRLNQTPN